MQLVNSLSQMSAKKVSLTLSIFSYFVPTASSHRKLISNLQLLIVLFKCSAFALTSSTKCCNLLSHKIYIIIYHVLCFATGRY